MHVDTLTVAVGAAICAIPILLGLLVDHWPRPDSRHNPRVSDMLIPEGAWERKGMRDEGDLYEATYDPWDRLIPRPIDGCDCAHCRHLRSEALTNAQGRRA